MDFKEIPTDVDFVISKSGVIKRKQVVTIRSNGRILRKKERVLKVETSQKGYKIVALCRNGIRKTKPIHRLVAITYLPNPKKLKEVNHKNGIKSDNRVENLEWCTRQQNIKHAYTLGLRNHRGENNSNAKLTRDEVETIREMASNGVCSKAISVGYNISMSSVYNIISKRTWL